MSLLELFEPILNEPIILTATEIEGFHGTSANAAEKIVATAKFNVNEDSTLRLGVGAYFYDKNQTDRHSAAELAKTFAKKMRGHSPVGILLARVKFERVADFECPENQKAFVRTRNAIGRYLVNAADSEQVQWLRMLGLEGRDYYEFLDNIAIRCIRSRNIECQGIRMNIETLDGSPETHTVVCVDGDSFGVVEDIRLVP